MGEQKLISLQTLYHVYQKDHFITLTIMPMISNMPSKIGLGGEAPILWQKLKDEHKAGGTVVDRLAIRCAHFCMPFLLVFGVMFEKKDGKLSLNNHLWTHSFSFLSLEEMGIQACLCEVLGEERMIKLILSSCLWHYQQGAVLYCIVKKKHNGHKFTWRQWAGALHRKQNSQLILCIHPP